MLKGEGKKKMKRLKKKVKGPRKGGGSKNRTIATGRLKKKKKNKNAVLTKTATGILWCGNLKKNHSKKMKFQVSPKDTTMCK